MPLLLGAKLPLRPCLGSEVGGARVRGCRKELRKVREEMGRGGVNSYTNF